MGTSRSAGGCYLLPALVGLDLLLNVLPVGTLSSLLGHSHQLDQLRPGRGEEKENSWVQKPSVGSNTGRDSYPKPS